VLELHRDTAVAVGVDVDLGAVLGQPLLDDLLCEHLARVRTPRERERHDRSTRPDPTPHDLSLSSLPSTCTSWPSGAKRTTSSACVRGKSPANAATPRP